MIKIRKKSPYTLIEMTFKTVFSDTIYKIARRNKDGKYVVNTANGEYVATYNYSVIKENLDGNDWEEIK